VSLLHQYDVERGREKGDRPKFSQRLQVGFPSSHLIRRALHVKHPVLTFGFFARILFSPTWRSRTMTIPLALACAVFKSMVAPRVRLMRLRLGERRVDNCPLGPQIQRKTFEEMNLIQVIRMAYDRSAAKTSSLTSRERATLHCHL
jgi:hypothetical protein